MLVSALVPTADRAAYALFAVDCFLRQTWTETELVVIDDGAESIAGLFAGVPLVRNTRFTVKSTVGEKRNAGVNFSRGELVRRLHVSERPAGASPTRGGVSTGPPGDLSAAFVVPPSRLWILAFATGCRALKISLGQFWAVVGVRSREWWEQDENTVYIAPPRWSLNRWKPLHQPAEPEPLPEVQLG